MFLYLDVYFRGCMRVDIFLYGSFRKVSKFVREVLEEVYNLGGGLFVVYLLVR